MLFVESAGQQNGKIFWQNSRVSKSTMKLGLAVPGWSTSHSLLLGMCCKFDCSVMIAGRPPRSFAAGEVTADGKTRCTRLVFAFTKRRAVHLSKWGFSCCFAGHPLIWRKHSCIAAPSLDNRNVVDVLNSDSRLPLGTYSKACYNSSQYYTRYFCHIVLCLCSFRLYILPFFFTELGPLQFVISL